jgi:hypothetical protein
MKKLLTILFILFSLCGFSQNIKWTFQSGRLVYVTNQGAYADSASVWAALATTQPSLSGTGFVKITGTTISYDNSTYLTTTGSAANLTGFPTLNQNTTGSAATLTTPRAINGVNFNGSAAITVTAAANTLTGTTLASGITASSLTSFGSSIALGTPASGVLTNCTFPTLNQNTTGSAATLTTPRAINGVNFDGSAAITVTAAANTLTGTTLASGITASSLTSFGSSIALGTPASGVLTNCTFPTLNQNTSGTASNITASSNTSLTSLANLVTVGTIGTGTWQGTLVAGQYGGTGVANTGHTITIGGNVAFSGAFAFTGTLSNTTTVTFPTTGTLAILGANTFTGTQTLAANSTSNAPLVFTASGSSLLTNVVQGAEEIDANGLKYHTNETTAGRGFIPAYQKFTLTSNGSTISTIANFFGTTSNITLVSGAEYIIEIDCYFTNTTAGTVTWTFTNSAAPTSQNIHARFSPAAGIVAPAGSAAATYLEGDVQGNSTAAEALTTSASLTTATTQWAHFSIHLFNGTGTSLKIQATKLVGGTITPLVGSYWTCTRIPTGNIGIFAN